MFRQCHGRGIRTEGHKDHEDLMIVERQPASEHRRLQEDSSAYKLEFLPLIFQSADLGVRQHRNAVAT